jgi:hypothetical protein
MITVNFRVKGKIHWFLPMNQIWLQHMIYDKGRSHGLHYILFNIYKYSNKLIAQVKKT